MRDLDYGTDDPPPFAEVLEREQGHRELLDLGDDR